MHGDSVGYDRTLQGGGRPYCYRYQTLNKRYSSNRSISRVSQKKKKKIRGGTIHIVVVVMRVWCEKNTSIVQVSVWMMVGGIGAVVLNRMSLRN